MSKPYDEKLEAYHKLREQHPDEPLRFFADRFGVNVGTVSRWSKALKKLDIKGEALDELRAKIEKEMEAKYKGIYEDQEQARAAAAAKKEEAERLVSENRRQHHQRVFNECARVDIWPSETVDVTWNGHRMTLVGGVKNTVPEVIAGVWLDSQKQKQQAAQTIDRYKMGQFLGKMGRVR